MPVTQREIALQMLAQLRILDPAVSAEIGTPERKIIDTVSQALADAQIDLTLLEGSLDIDAKIGTNLENFLALFGFARQRATAAVGYVTFSRITPSTQDIRIPANTQVMAPNYSGSIDSAMVNVFFLTTVDGILPAGQTEVIVPVKALVPGVDGNVAADSITSFSGVPVYGVTAVTNELATYGGADRESDNALKVRFKNTVFRNLAGTEDQFLALAISTQFTQKANVVGPISRFREYIQVPDVDDQDKDVHGNFAPTDIGEGGVSELILAQDEFDHSSGDLNGKVAPLGDTWSTVGSGNDFTINVVDHTARRTAVGDTVPRFAISGLDATTTQYVRVDTKVSSLSGGYSFGGIVARYQNETNYFRATIYHYDTPQLEVYKVVSGTPTNLLPPPGLFLLPSLQANAWWTLALSVSQEGHWQVWAVPQGQPLGTPLYSGFDSSLAPGGVLETGKMGFRDGKPDNDARTRDYDNFRIWVPGGGDQIPPGHLGVQGEYTSALSIVPHSKYAYTGMPTFVSNGEVGTEALFYREDVDYRVNTIGSLKDRGDAARYHAYANGIDPRGTAAQFKPNLTFLSVYGGDDPDVNAIRPQDIVLFEHSYMSDASRNDYTRNITNAVDVFIEDAGPITEASAVVAAPGDATANRFTSGGKYHWLNFRRKGEPMRPPILGNICMPLFWQPTLELPEKITVEGTLTAGGDPVVAVYYRDYHYFLVEDITDLRGTVRARDSIEWNPNEKGQKTTDDPEGPYTGPSIAEFATSNSITIEKYGFNRNIVDLQIALESSKQVTTDVLGHSATPRFLKLDLSIMYTGGRSSPGTQTAIQTEMQRYFRSLYFGHFVQLSDLIQTVHDVPGVDNVRWTSDLPNNTDLTRVWECDLYGRPLTNVVVDRISRGSSTQTDQQRVIITGEPTGGTWALQEVVDDAVTKGTGPMGYNTSATGLLEKLTNAGWGATSVTGTGVISDPFIVTFGATEVPLMTCADQDINLTGGPYVYNTDFALRDNELPLLPLGQIEGDTVPGFILRTRAQNTWTRR